MQQDVLISVVVPTLNAAKWLPQCLASLSEQTFKHFEVLVVDGGSSDDTQQWVDQFASNSTPRIRWHQEDGLGVYSAMNWGYQNASGLWCYFLGADDVLHSPEVFERMADVLNQTKADLVYGDVLMKSKRRRYCGPVTLDTLLFHKNVSHQAIFYSKALLARMGGYSLRYPVWSDWDLNIRCFKTPGVVHLWVDQLIAVFNDENGMSVAGDPVLNKELPKFSIGQVEYVPKSKSNSSPTSLAQQIKSVLGMR